MSVYRLVHDLLAFSYILGCVPLLAFDEPPQDIRLVTGRVTNAEGEPIKGASVEWGHYSATRESRQVVRTNEQGAYQLEVTEIGADYRVGVSALGYAPQWRDGIIPALKSSETKSTLDFKLGPPLTLNGIVVDRSGKPIAGVRVIARSPTSGFISSFSMPTPSYPFPGPERDCVTDAEGKFSIRYLPTTFMTADEQEKGHPFDMRIETETGLMIMGKAYSKIENRLKINRSYVSGAEGRQGRIRAKVMDEETGEPIQDFKVVLRHRPTMRVFESEYGEFTLEGLTVNRPQQFFVYADGYAPFVARPFVSDGQGVFLECALQRHEGVKGKILDPSGKPISNAIVLAGVRKENDNRFEWGSFQKLIDGFMSLSFVQRMKTGSDGEFEFSVGSNKPILAILAPGHARRLIVPDEWPDLTQHDTLTVTLQPECVIHGQVIRDGQPEANCWVSLRKSADWNLHFGQVQADETGNYRIENLAPGMYHVSAYQSTKSSSFARLTRVLEIEEGETRVCNLDTPGGNSSLSGKAPPFAIVSAQRKELLDSDSDVSQASTFASPEGEYCIEDLHAGTYTVIVRQVSGLSSYIRPNNQNEEIKIDGKTTKDFEDPLQLLQTLEFDALESPAK